MLAPRTIYRPTACREFSVVSPAEHCRDPLEVGIERVPARARFAEALARVSAALLKDQPKFIALSMAPTWAAENPGAATVGAEAPLLVRALMENVGSGDETTTTSPSC